MTDMGYWRANRVVKNEKDLDAVGKVLLKKFGSIKHIYIELITCGDNWPTVGCNEFMSFVRDYHI